MRILSAAVLLVGLAARAAEPPQPKAYPLWDGAESIEQYAKKAGLEPAKNLDLGNGVKLEIVLIPAGKFTMGTEKPTPVDEEGFRQKIVVGRAVLAAGVGALLVLLGTVIIRALRRRGRPQYSLGRFVVMTVVAGVALLGGLHWHFSAKAFAEAKAEYQAASARFKDSYETERPAHEVTISKPYYLGKYEVTQGQYEQIMGNNPSQFKGRDLPVECVSWDDAQEFCKKVSEKTGQSVRLPTDAEWEHACRAGTKTLYCTGDTEADLDRAAWYGNNSNGTTHPVGQKVPNAWGAYDMHGNVWEWVQDFYAPYKAEAATDPIGPSQGQYRVLRGGSWGDGPRRCRSAFRIGYPPDLRNFFGFRVVGSSPRTAM
jgi:formylglycine-generating enzyme required for sulfatase activity